MKTLYLPKTNGGWTWKGLLGKGETSIQTINFCGFHASFSAVYLVFFAHLWVSRRKVHKQNDYGNGSLAFMILRMWTNIHNDMQDWKHLFGQNHNINILHPNWISPKRRIKNRFPSCKKLFEVRSCNGPYNSLMCLAYLNSTWKHLGLCKDFPIKKRGSFGKGGIPTSLLFQTSPYLGTIFMSWKKESFMSFRGFDSTILNYSLGGVGHVTKNMK